MKTRLFAAIASVLFLGLGAAPATALTTGDYIVSLKSDVALSDPAFAGKVFRDRWTNALNAVRVSLSRDEAAALATNPAVAAVELNRKRQIAATQTINPSHFVDNWALDALEGGAPAMDGTYNYETTGTGVTVAVVDTGVFPNADIGARLTVAKNFVNGAGGLGSAKDCNGHGTHVASIAAGTKFGVAKGASIYNLRVLDCYGSGYDADIVDALDWLAFHQPAGRTVVNMSIGGSGAYDITMAVDRLLAKGISVAVAAGNETDDACNGMIIPKAETNKPTAGLVTVGAYSSDSGVSWFSNYGTCVDLFAPGSAILSRTIATDPDTEEPLVDPVTHDYIPVDEAWSGTSMATPVVVGSIARYLQFNPTATVAQIESTLTSNALEGALDFSGSDAWNWDETLGGSPNLMLDYSSVELPVGAATLNAPANLTYGQSGSFSVNRDYANEPVISTAGNCHAAEALVYADKGVGTCALSATFAAEPGLAGRTITANIRLNLATASVGNPVAEPGWESSFVLPQKQTLALVAAPSKITGGCKVTRLTLMASASSGSCVLTYNQFNDEYFQYPKTVVTIKVGAATQSWASKVTKAGKIKYGLKAIQLAAVFAPVTDYKYTGVWSSITGPCSLDLSNSRSGAMLTHNGIKGESCIISLTAPGAFKLAPLTTTWTVTK